MLTMESDVFIHSSEIEIEDLGKGIKRQILGFNPDLMMVKVWFEAGAVGELHAHGHRQVTYVESGAFDVNIDGEIQRLTAGDSFFIPADVRHGCVCREPGILIDVFTPIREEFVNAG